MDDNPYDKLKQFIENYSNNKTIEEFPSEVGCYIIKARARDQFTSTTASELLDALIKHPKDSAWPTYANAVVGLLMSYGYKDEFRDKYHMIKEALEGEELKKSMGGYDCVCVPKMDLYLKVYDY